MKRAPCVGAQWGSSSSGLNDDSDHVPDHAQFAQFNSSSPLTGAGLHVASFWKSPRNRREAVQVSLRQYEDHPYVDFRVYAMNGSGRMVPTSRGISIGLKTLPQFCKAAGDALRKATAIGLTVRSSA